jgi:hypothetical protein
MKKIQLNIQSYKDANDGFNKSMDKTFSTWQRSGNSYTRRIIAYSTIWGDEYEEANVEAYKRYVMKPFDLETDLSEERLSSLSSIAIQALIGAAQDEVQKKSEEIFGTKAEHADTARKEGAGEFGRHIGYGPELIADPDPDKGLESMYSDRGMGEFGRILRSYYYYEKKEETI